MIINIQQFLEELVSGMIVSYADVNQGTKKCLDTLIVAFSIKESATITHKQKSLIEEFIKATFFSMRLEIPENETVKKFSVATRSHRYPYGLEEPCSVSMVQLLSDFEYRSNFFDLFKQKNPTSNDFVFPSISNNPEKMQKLAFLLDFCAAHPNSLECAEIDTDKLQLENKSQWNLYQPAPVSLTTNMNPNMVILGGFVIALGIAAVALAMTVLSCSGFAGGFAILGGAAIGYGAVIVIRGFFAKSLTKNDESPDNLYEKVADSNSTYPLQVQM